MPELFPAMIADEQARYERQRSPLAPWRHYYLSGSRTAECRVENESSANQDPPAYLYAYCNCLCCSPFRCSISLRTWGHMRTWFPGKSPIGRRHGIIGFSCPHPSSCPQGVYPLPALHSLLWGLASLWSDCVPGEHWRGPELGACLRVPYDPALPHRWTLPTQHIP